ncbi:hypothetical protein [Sphingomonas glacialis]|uniref:Uncharacterized protein n=1 Tax=Sphingomonas glacialis TaxID=658225 RepID=A0A502FWU6_9SPHN|nr:hypothetical protein [Sphingomonas glacialis]TPG53954.1 hypothetical protein EAH76_04385 [Sphingomonas glacialis]
MVAPVRSDDKVHQPDKTTEIQGSLVRLRHAARISQIKGRAMGPFSPMFVLISMFAAGSIGVSGGFILGGLSASGKISDLEARIHLLERLIARITGTSAMPAELTELG